MAAPVSRESVLGALVSASLWPVVTRVVPPQSHSLRNRRDDTEPSLQRGRPYAAPAM
ncbi:MAG: hypothetical protein ACI8U3_001731 [Brevundimonas sp.]|jgi:hypothetical protein